MSGAQQKHSPNVRTQAVDTSPGAALPPAPTVNTSSVASTLGVSASNVQAAVEPPAVVADVTVVSEGSASSTQVRLQPICASARHLRLPSAIRPTPNPPRCSQHYVRRLRQPLTPWLPCRPPLLRTSALTPQQSLSSPPQPSSHRQSHRRFCHRLCTRHRLCHLLGHLQALLFLRLWRLPAAAAAAAWFSSQL